MKGTTLYMNKHNNSIAELIGTEISDSGITIRTLVKQDMTTTTTIYISDSDLEKHWSKMVDFVDKTPAENNTKFCISIRCPSGSTPSEWHKTFEAELNTELMEYFAYDLIDTIKRKHEFWLNEAELMVEEE